MDVIPQVRVVAIEPKPNLRNQQYPMKYYGFITQMWVLAMKPKRKLSHPNHSTRHQNCPNIQFLQI